jgi:hypothetical protein
MVKKATIKPNELKVRDPLMVKVINGATKASVHTDRKREQKRTACRKRVIPDDR